MIRARARRGREGVSEMGPFVGSLLVRTSCLFGVQKKVPVYETPA